MKKLGLLVMPFIAVSFLLGCNGGGNDPEPELYTMTFNGNHCKANNKDTYEKGTEVSFEITPDSYCMLPENKEGITVEGIDEYDYVVSSTGTAMFSCVMTANVTISVTAKPKPVNTLYITQANGMSLPSAIDVGESFEIIATNKSGDKVKAAFTSEDETITIKEENNKVIVTGELGGPATIKCQASGYVTATRKLEVISLIMHIKQDADHGFPTSIYTENEYTVAAFDNNNQEVTDATFIAADPTITITTKDNKFYVKGVSEGYGKIVCKAKGYRDADFTTYVKALKNMTIKKADGKDMPSVIDVNTTTAIAAYEGDVPLTSSVSFESSDEDIIKIDDTTNEIQGKNVGTATITAKAIGYKDATCKVEVRKTYDVVCDNNDFILSNLKATTDQDYKTTITVKSPKINEGLGYSVPDKLTSVIVEENGAITDYTYTPTENTFSAELVIPKKDITGKININLEVKELTPLCFENLEDNTQYIFYYSGVEASTIKIQYSYDNQSDWKDWPLENGQNTSNGGKTLDLEPHHKLYVKNTTSTLSTSPSNKVEFWASFKCGISGNINSMVNYQELTDYCFSNLFIRFSDKVITAPALPALKMAKNCYDSLFYRCSSLVSAPALPATELAEYCYYDMFDQCSSISKIPDLPATTIPQNSYLRMFVGCTGITSAYLPAPTEGLAQSCYESIFSGCSNLNYVKVGFGNNGRRDWPSDPIRTGGWLKNVASKGTFVWKGSSFGPETRGIDTVPEGWTCVNYE